MKPHIMLITVGIRGGDIHLLLVTSSLKLGLEKPCRFQTQGGSNEDLGRHQSVTGPVLMVALTRAENLALLPI
ncbi:hypothetical protein SAMN04488523_11554 [Sulfitobacter brevis]|uniref:Uncharacterized protein n=1 Tax=Sulfitobacter brevis TaxID=74348 RepID=A0A1I2FE40_9RHOB|nr:hypothetical protein SAMN04488523_11554 [Sulfitobacter brevis]